ncbi:nuclear transport factor 2 family protein [Litchfieldia alkalitelluris]|uniref:nuclear transport factor 2 family protein n=1 Tax=Litchfieldia alkalitelluris TaxID=304268 RepID=UPI0009971319|nr:nuclear transport factor 2 family protein [Litchfieldia alkalitelluris]
MSRAEELAQKQLDAYNNQDIETFVAQYSPDIVVMDFPSNQITLSGREDFKKRYKALFESNPKQHAELTSRMVKGNIVIDHEYVTGRANGINVEAIAMYETTDEYITKVWFVR